MPTKNTGSAVLLLSNKVKLKAKALLIIKRVIHNAKSPIYQENNTAPKGLKINNKAKINKVHRETDVTVNMTRYLTNVPHPRANQADKNNSKREDGQDEMMS